MVDINLPETDIPIAVLKKGDPHFDEVIQLLDMKKVGIYGVMNDEKKTLGRLAEIAKLYSGGKRRELKKKFFEIEFFEDENCSSLIKAGDIEFLINDTMRDVKCIVREV